MAAWIGATDSQRFWQYILPEAQRYIDTKWWETSIARIEVEGKAAVAALAALDPNTDALTRGTARREVERLRRDWAACKHNLKVNLATVAEGKRRKAAQKEYRRAK